MEFMIVAPKKAILMPTLAVSKCQMAECTVMGSLKLDKSPPQIQNPEISNWTRMSVEASIKTARKARQFNLKFRDFGFEVGFCPISVCFWRRMRQVC
jgi:hypothetical protein